MTPAQFIGSDLFTQTLMFLGLYVFMLSFAGWTAAGLLAHFANRFLRKELNKEIALLESQRDELIASINQLRLQELER